jgi:hypothetical protein
MVFWVKVILLSHLARTTLTNKEIPVIVDGVNHILAPIALTGRTHQPVLTQGLDIRKPPQDLVEFFRSIDRGWVNALHQVLPILKNPEFQLLFLRRSGTSAGLDRAIARLAIRQDIWVLTVAIPGDSSQATIAECSEFSPVERIFSSPSSL